MSADLGSFGRHLRALVLGAGSLLTAVVVLADVLVRRADLGRRRALGASGGELVALIAARTGPAALSGAVAGTTIGSAVAAHWGVAAPWDLVLGAGTLAVLAARVAAAPPALVAAYGDPARVLRTRRDHTVPRVGFEPTLDRV